ncbi:MAG: DUF1800 domain-containing protein [Pseudohongiellaceae bacterium]
MKLLGRNLPRFAGLGVPRVAECCVVAVLSLAAAPAMASSPYTAPSSWVNDLSPVSELDWNYERAAHLLERAGFGGTPEQIEHLADMTPQQAVDHLVDFHALDADPLPDFELSGLFDPAMDPFPNSRAEAVRQARDNGESMGAKVAHGESRPIQPVVNKFFYGLRGNEMEARRLATWWADRMVVTERPLQEKMALFWHGHFATTDTKVRDHRKMLKQLNLFHENAVGNFGELLLAVTQDPAMLTFLDNAENIKAHPNENFGRELMELFSLGEGNYTEQDIREASRAFTGWTDEKLQFVIREEDHDDGVKTVLGQTGNFDGEDIIEILLQQESTAEFMSAKLYRFFVRDTLSADLQYQLADVLRRNNYELAPFLKTVFLSRDFYSNESVATQFKSPVQLMVSTYRKMGLQRMPTIPDFNAATGNLGQRLLYPPNVAGWAGGSTWITPATLLQRGNLMRDVLFPDVEGFLARDPMPGIYRRVEERLAQGMNITQATTEGDSGASMLADSDEAYNTRYGAYMGYVVASETVIQIPRFPADLSLSAMLRDARVDDVSAAVAYLETRFLRHPLSDSDMAVLEQFLRDELGADELSWRSEETEIALKRVLHLLLSAPEYQLS